MFLLINNYQSEETMPYIVSAEKFASYAHQGKKP